MSQQDLIQFINRHFEAGMTQEDVRQLAHRHDISDEQYAAALLMVLSQRLREDGPTSSLLTPGLLLAVAGILLAAGAVALTALHGRFAAVAGWAAIALSAGAAFWSWRKKNAARR